MLFLLLLNIIFLQYPFGVLLPGGNLPALIEPVLDVPFDVSLVLPTAFDLDTLEPSKTNVFAPQTLPGPDQYFSYLTKDHDAVPLTSLVTPTDPAAIPEADFTLLPGHDSDSSEILRFASSLGDEFISIRDSGATDGYVDRNLLYDLKTRDMGKPPFLTYSTFDVVVASVCGWYISTLLVTGFFRATTTVLVGFCHIIMIRRAKSKKHRQWVQREKELVKQYKDAFEESRGHFKELCVTQQQLEDCQAELTELQQTGKQNRSEHFDLQEQYSNLEKELAKATQKSKERKEAHAQELSETTQQKISLEADRKAQSELIGEQAQALQDKDAELVEYKAQAKKSEELDIIVEQLQNALQKKDTELSTYKAKAHKADELDQSLQRLQSDEKIRDADIERLTQENKTFKKTKETLQTQLAILKKEKADAILESDHQSKASKEREESLKMQVSNLTKKKDDAVFDAVHERDASVKAEGSLMSETDQLKKSEAKLLEQVANLTKEKDDAILRADRERSMRDRFQHASRSKANQLKKDLAKSKEETAMYKRDMDQIKADAEAQEKRAPIMYDLQKRVLLSGLSRMERLVDSAEGIDHNVHKNRELVEKFEKGRDERMAASPWHSDLTSPDKEVVTQEENFLETKTEEESAVDTVSGSPRPDNDRFFDVLRQTRSPTEQSTDSGFYEDIKSDLDQAPPIVDATTIPDTFLADSVLHSEDEVQVKFPEKDMDIAAPQETQQWQTLSNLLRPQHNLEAKSMLPQGISVLQLAQTVIIRQVGSTIFVADDLRRREPWLRKEAKAYKDGSLRARKNWHKETLAASVKDLGLQFAHNYKNLSQGQKAFDQLPNFKGSRRRHSLSYGEKDSVIMAKIKNPQIPRTDTREVPYECAWLSNNVLEEIFIRASRRSASSFDDTLHLKSIMLEVDVNPVPASSLLRFTDEFFTTASRDSGQLSTVPRNDASYDEFESASIFDIIGADDRRLMRQKLAYAESFSSSVDGVPFDKYRSTWSQAKEIRIESFDQKNQSRIAGHLPPTKPPFDYSTESVQELLAATAHVANADVVPIAQENERPKPFASDINYLRHSGSTGIETHYERERALAAKSTVNAAPAPPTLSNLSSSTTTTVIAAPSAPPPPVSQAQPALPAFSRGVGTSLWATKAPASAAPASTPAAQVALQAAPTTTAAPSRSLNSSRNPSITPAPPASPAVTADNASTTNSAPLRGLNASRFATNNPPAPSPAATPRAYGTATANPTFSRGLGSSSWAGNTAASGSNSPLPTSGPSRVPSAPFNGQTIPSGPRNHRGGRGYGRGGRGRGRGGAFR